MTQTLERPATTAYQYALGGALPQAVEENGTWKVRGVKIFKAATFKDSRGRQHDWTTEELDEIVANFNQLRSDGAFVDVPIRLDHSKSIKDVVGYFEAIRRESEFLVGDWEFTKPEAAVEFNRGTFRSRSIEIGSYETNGATPATYFPVAMGLAFVDIGAVEGLFNRHTPESNMDPVTFRIKGVSTADHAAVQAHIDELEKPVTPEVFTFKIGGEETTDFAKAQARITELETFAKEQHDTARTSFVDALVEAKKLTAPQGDDTKAFALGLSDEQFAQWKKSFDLAPVVFGNVVSSGNGSTNNTGGLDAAAQELITAERVIKGHVNTGMATEQIRKTGSFATYTRLAGHEFIF